MRHIDQYPYPPESTTISVLAIITDNIRITIIGNIIISINIIIIVPILPVH